MKKDSEKRKTLAQKDYRNLWGDEGPYSQVRLCEETRILDDSVSRVFLVVEAEINPFTFEWVRSNRKKFAHDAPVLQLLDHAENRGKLGYLVSAGEVELEDEESREFARKHADMAVQTLIRMHKAVIKEFNLHKKFGESVDKKFVNGPLVWNESIQGIQEVPTELWDDMTRIGSASGIKNNKVRFFFVLAFDKGFEFNKKSVVLCMENLIGVSEDFKVEVEDCESFFEYMLLTALVPMDVAPADFVETVISRINKNSKKAMFLKNYFVSNGKKPTPQELMDFVAMARRAK